MIPDNGDQLYHRMNKKLFVDEHAAWMRVGGHRRTVPLKKARNLPSAVFSNATLTVYNLHVELCQTMEVNAEPL